MITADYIFFNGGRMTPAQAAAYNQLQEEIKWKEAAGKDVESLKDCSHKMINDLIFFKEAIR
jgi:hypothetical protein